MEKLKVCFIGVGSIAKRHIKNLSAICQEDGIQLSIDAVRRSGKKDSDEIFEKIDNIFNNISDLNSIYDIVFITNPTDLHIDTLKEVTAVAKNFFIEKPLTSLKGIDKVSDYILKEGAVYYVACPLRYSAVIQYIKNNVNLKDVISVRSISSSYLPDWRPEQDYRMAYSAHKSMGGGVSIDLIHEWDYLTFLFGMPIKVNYMGGKKSRLEIDSDDYAIYISEYEDKIVELHLDYFGRKTIRNITLFTNEDTIIGDIANNKIYFLKSEKVIDFQEERDDYQKRELRHFLDMINGNAEADSDINHAVNVLKLTQGEI